MAERKAGNWIRGFQYYTSESEAPNSYLTWVAISTIAGAVQRQCHVKWLYYNYFPNMYIILVGPPGRTHKSSAMWFGRNLLDQIGVPTASESGSKEALIGQMILKNKLKRRDSNPITVHSSDFMTFIQTSGPAMIEFLTDIYDCPDKWEYNTKQRGPEIIKKAYVNLLAGTTPSWIAQTFNIAFVEQGFASRTLFIYEQEPRFHKAFAEITAEMQQMYLNLVEDLVTISKIKGEFQWTKDGIEWFRHWYEKELPLEKLDFRLQGYLHRKPTHVLKLGMILCLSETDVLELNETYLKTAKLILDSIEPNMVKTFSSVGKNPFASDMERILHEIKVEGSISEQEIRRRNAGTMEKQKLEDALESLHLMGLIKTVFKEGKLFWVHVKESA